GDVLKSLMIIRPRMDSYSGFKGTGQTIVFIDRQKYVADFTISGFGFDDTYDGTGILIQTLRVTHSDSLPGSLTFQDDTNIKLTAVPNGGRAPMRLTGTQNGATFDCT